MNNYGGDELELVAMIKMLADETRIRILNLLKDDKLCVCEISFILEIKQSNASRHLNKLKGTKIISSEKKAQWVYYRVNEVMVSKHLFIKELLARELDGIEQCQRDREKLYIYRQSALTCENIRKKETDIIDKYMELSRQKCLAAKPNYVDR